MEALKPEKALEYISITDQEPPRAGWFVGWDGEFPEVWSGENYHGALNCLQGLSKPPWPVMKAGAEKITHWAALPDAPPTTRLSQGA